MREPRLVPIVMAADLPLCACCGEEPWCRKHKKHYADCSCLGPHNAEELGYHVIEKNGRLWGRKIRPVSRCKKGG